MYVCQIMSVTWPPCAWEYVEKSTLFIFNFAYGYIYIYIQKQDVWPLRLMLE